MSFFVSEYKLQVLFAPVQHLQEANITWNRERNQLQKVLVAKSPEGKVIYHSVFAIQIEMPVISEEKKAQRAAKRRREILDAAMDVFAEKGYHAAGISDIAERLQIGHGTFYRYFRNKLDIFSAVLDQVIAAISQVVSDEDAEATSNIEEYRDQLNRIGNRLMELFQDDERLGNIVFYEAMGVDKAVSGKVLLAFDLFSRYVEAYLENGVARGFFRADLDIQVTARMLVAMIFESIKQSMMSEDKVAMGRRWTDGFIALFIDGIRAR